MSLVQVRRVTADDDRVPRGQKPCFQFDLNENETIVGIAHVWDSDWGNAERKTVDHSLTVWVETVCS